MAVPLVWSGARRSVHWPRLAQGNGWAPHQPQPRHDQHCRASARSRRPCCSRSLGTRSDHPHRVPPTSAQRPSSDSSRSTNSGSTAQSRAPTNRSPRSHRTGPKWMGTTPTFPSTRTNVPERRWESITSRGSAPQTVTSRGSARYRSSSSRWAGASSSTASALASINPSWTWSRISTVRSRK